LGGASAPAAGAAARRMKKNGIDCIGSRLI
jgi:hypothetical protein